MKTCNTLTNTNAKAILPASPNTSNNNNNNNADARQGGCIDVLSRIFVLNVPTSQSEVCLWFGFALLQAQLKEALEQYGDVEVFTCVNGKGNTGWAFVGYTSNEAISRLKQDYTLVSI